LIITIFCRGIIVVEGNNFYKLVGCKKHDNKKNMASLNKVNLENAQINLNPFLIGFASHVNNIAFDILQVVNVIGGGDFDAGCTLN
jgi:hypothetical protein